MTTVADFKLKLLRVLGDEPVNVPPDPITGTAYNADLLLSSIHAAMIAILPWRQKRSVASLIGDSVTKTFALPGDLHAIDGMLDMETMAFVPQVQMRAGESFPANDRSWFLFPEGSVTFATAPSLKGITIYYGGLWTAPLLDMDVLETPAHADLAMIYYAAAYCVLPEGNASADIRQYGTRVDSGNPEHNPKAKMSLHFLKMFEIEAQRLPAVSRGVLS